MLTIGDDAKQLGVHLDSFILLGKLHFAELNFEDALKYYDKANIDSLEERQLPPRSLKIMAEAFAIKVNLVMESFFFDNRISCFETENEKRCPPNISYFVRALVNLRICSKKL